MSLAKAIENSKEKRKPYYGAKRFDYTCRNHGSCMYCRRNRLHNSFVKMMNADDTAEGLTIKGRAIRINKDYN